MLLTALETFRDNTRDLSHICFEKSIEGLQRCPNWSSVVVLEATKHNQTGSSRNTRQEVFQGGVEVARTFSQMAGEAFAEVPAISAEEAYRQMQDDPHTLLVDVRDPADIVASGIIPGAKAISLGSLTYKADNEVPQEWRDPELADRDRPIIATCILGPMGALGGKLLKDMGFTNVRILEGGVQAWLDAGFVTEPFKP